MRDSPKKTDRTRQFHAGVLFVIGYLAIVTAFLVSPLSARWSTAMGTVVLAPAATFPVIAGILGFRRSAGTQRRAVVIAATAFTAGSLWLLSLVAAPTLFAADQAPTTAGITVNFSIYALALVTAWFITAERHSISYLLDGLLMASAALFVSSGLLLDPVITAFDGDLAETTLAVSSPVFDILLCTTAILAARRRESFLGKRSMVLLAVSLVFLTIGDGTYAQDLLPLVVGKLTVLSWAAFLGISALALSGVTAVTSGDRRASTTAMLIPYVPAIAAAIYGTYLVTHDAVSTTTWVLAAFVGVMLVARQFVALLENVRMASTLERTVEELQVRERELEHLSMHDALTALPNRRYLSQRVIERRRQSTGAFVVLLLDVDDFKQVNDEFGHNVGDALLVHISDTLRQCVRSEDVVARLGGDEFAILLEGADVEVTQALVERMRTALNRRASVDGHQLRVKVSIGMALGEALDEFDGVLREADMAMYDQKRASKKGDPVVFQSEDDDVTLDNCPG